MKIYLQRTTLFLAAILFSMGTIWSQKVEKSFSASGKSIKIIISSADLIVEGNSGSNLVIATEGLEPPPERAKGLKPLFNSAEDNTGLGLEVSETNNSITIKKASNQRLEYHLKVPSNAHLIIEETSWMGGDFSFKNLKGEVEAKTQGSDLIFTDVSGPIIASSTNGDITIIYAQVNPDKPNSISNISGDIDISLPASTKANLELSSISGEIYTDMNIQTKGDEKEGMTRLGGSNNISGTLNGGGVEINLKAISSDIFIRTKK